MASLVYVFDIPCYGLVEKSINFSESINQLRAKSDSYFANFVIDLINELQFEDLNLSDYEKLILRMKIKKTLKKINKK